MDRRLFLSAAPLVLAPLAAKAVPSERINLCVVGVRGRGKGLGLAFAKLPGAQVSHVCDVNTAYLEPYAKSIEAVQKSKPKMEQDLRKVLDDPGVDGLVVATPDHWHALATIWGCQKKKHVYVEKPVSHDVNEGRKMVEAARAHERVVQAGTQSRSVPHYIEAIKHIRDGKLGKVHMAKAWNSQFRRRVDAVKDSPTPKGLDWDIWQGPAEEKPFNANRYTYGWRWLWEYGTGDMGNDGVHDLDIARWGLGVGFPSAVTCVGDKLFHAGDMQETPDTQIVTFSYPEQKAVLVYEQRLWSPYHQEGHENGVAFYGSEAYMIIGRRHWKVVGRKNKVVFDKAAPFSDTPHQQDFLDRIKDGKRPACDIEDGHLSSALAHLGNLSCRVGRPLKLDPKTESVLGDDEAQKLMKRAGRKGYEIPEKP
ncbi:MAG: Gfo/Idh/MocA family oxidoreductase [Gemmataceae bacterium]|nr:Gfo/Idh/MocA family oxidoreductase [Gemmataceae bacterium]